MRILSCILAIGLAAGTADAALIDFDSHPAMNWHEGPADPDTIISDHFSSDGIIFGRAGVSVGVAAYSFGSVPSNASSTPNGACGLDAAGIIPDVCTGDIHFRFVSLTDPLSAATTDTLSFMIGDSGGDLDDWIIHLFDMDDNELLSETVAGIGHNFLSYSLANIHRVHIEWGGGPYGYVIDDIGFEISSGPADVAEPAALSLVLAGGMLIGCAAARNRRKQGG